MWYVYTAKSHSSVRSCAERCAELKVVTVKWCSGTGDIYLKWDKPDSERQWPLCVFSCRQNLDLKRKCVSRIWKEWGGGLWRKRRELKGEGREGEDRRRWYHLGYNDQRLHVVSYAESRCNCIFPYTHGTWEWRGPSGRKKRQSVRGGTCGW